ncbi:YhfC family intramembrane metalloprotease [Paenibacillus turpanensis]|uniref:YhfC family intramembrane metalloprotease n=1 Tax=Paenibacillus turpanensis TaxID=2689078 RepID=UPI00140A7014|nr:YhfC family intramembrane metalloprotease [Paenibacillus turpanensis]
MIEQPMISAGALAGAAMQILISLLLPILFIVYFHKRGGFSWKAAGVGILVFVVFSQVLEKLLHVYVFSVNPVTAQALGNPWLYALYGGLAAGFFEEFGRYFGWKLLLRNRLERKDGISLGVGHGGIEAILIGVIGGVQTIAFALLMQQGKLEEALGASAPPEAVAQIRGALVTTPWWEYIAAGLERLPAMLLHIAFSLLVLIGVRSGKLKYVLYAALLHAAVDFPVALYQKGMGSLPVLYVYLVLIGAAAAVIIARSKNWATFLRKS